MHGSTPAARGDRVSLKGDRYFYVTPIDGYLHVLAALEHDTGMPLAAYLVCGMYSMITAAERGRMIGERTMLESLFAMVRAGADLVITYFAIDVAAAPRNR